MTIQFSVNVTPVPQSRPRVTRKHVYEAPRCAAYKSRLRAEAVAAMKGQPPLNDLVCVFINIRRNKKIDSRSFGDIDNHIKSILDACNGVCYTDDSQIFKVIAVKIQSKQEGVDIAIYVP